MKTKRTITKETWMEDLETAIRKFIEKVDLNEIEKLLYEKYDDFFEYLDGDDYDGSESVIIMFVVDRIKYYLDVLASTCDMCCGHKFALEMLNSLGGNKKKFKKNDLILVGAICKVISEFLNSDIIGLLLTYITSDDFNEMKETTDLRDLLNQAISKCFEKHNEEIEE